jgi:hypothetical protein
MIGYAEGITKDAREREPAALRSASADRVDDPLRRVTFFVFFADHVAGMPRQKRTSPRTTLGPLVRLGNRRAAFSVGFGERRYRDGAAG